MATVRANQQGIKTLEADTTSSYLQQLDEPLQSSSKLNKNKNKNKNKNNDTKSQINITTRHQNPISIQTRGEPIKSYAVKNKT